MCISDRPSAEPDLIRMQLKEHKSLNDSISSRKNQGRDVLNAAKKVKLAFLKKIFVPKYAIRTGATLLHKVTLPFTDFTRFSVQRRDVVHQRENGRFEGHNGCSFSSQC